MRALALALSLIATPAIAAEQFDLVCTGDKDTMRYRIDLAAGEYCFNDCGRVMKIAEVTSGMLTLHRDKPTLTEPATAYATINRSTGEWRWYSYDPRYSHIMDIQGKCEMAPYSGMPRAKF